MVRATPPEGSVRLMVPAPAPPASEPVVSVAPLTVIELVAVHKFVVPMVMTAPPLLTFSAPVPPSMLAGRPPRLRLEVLVQTDPGPVTVAVALALEFWPMIPMDALIVPPV